MSGIRSKNTRPEILLRKGLHARGFRFRLHDRTLPGKPDLVFPRFRAVLFAHGCFWHQHQCHLFRWPSTRVDFWAGKLARNCETDAAAVAALQSMGWRVAIVWECALKGKTRLPFDEVIDRCDTWLRGDVPSIEIAGK